jgi:hypothetical protein
MRRVLFTRADPLTWVLIGESGQTDAQALQRGFEIVRDWPDREIQHRAYPKDPSCRNDIPLRVELDSDLFEEIDEFRRPVLGAFDLLGRLCLSKGVAS